MSSDLHILGLRAPDSNLLAKAKAYLACADAGVPVPPELVALFGKYGPDMTPDDLLEVEIKQYLQVVETPNEYGTRVKLADLPKDITYIYICNR